MLRRRAPDSYEGAIEVLVRFADSLATRPDVTFPEPAVCVLPLRHADEVLGAVDVFSVRADGRDDPQLRAAQALADIAAYAIAQARALQRATDLACQLQEALGSRIVIEQAKGILAERLKLDVTEAFAVLRRYSRNRSVRIAQVASDVVERRLSTDDLVAGAWIRRTRRGV